MFKGKKLNTGDIVSFKTYSNPLREEKAAVITAKDGVLKVLGKTKIPFHHFAVFSEDDFKEIDFYKSAEIAIPIESEKFCKDQDVFILTQNSDGYDNYIKGSVVAAFDGLVVIKKSSGDLFIGQALEFESAESKFEVAM